MAARQWTRRVAAAVAVLSSAGAQDVTVTGACDSKSFLNGLVFRVQGRTRSGAPWFQAVGALHYMYFDPDCAGSNDGSPRWILDNDRPNVTAERDLDNDGACNYHARINSRDTSFPPLKGDWQMNCDSGWQPKFLILLPGGQNPDGTSTWGPDGTKTSTTTRTATTSRYTGSSTTNYILPGGGNQTGAPGTCPTCPATSLALTGACEFKKSMNGAIFDFVNNSASGAPYYKARGLSLWIYFDPDCDGPVLDGSAPTPPRWIIDTSAPLPGRLFDLDGDGACDYEARYNATQPGSMGPPTSAVWKMFCGEGVGWQDVQLTLQAKSSKDGGPITLYVSAAPHRSGLVTAGAGVAALALLAR